ncbi:hypothetical protein PMI40_02795 [Herbaspirillum sp. YR522]|nr:hypothetical protein PMI40_02795 [Herbaspirillum sp. YR522]
MPLCSHVHARDDARLQRQDGSIDQSLLAFAANYLAK